MQSNAIAGTFWVIEMDETLSPEMTQDIKHLTQNSALSQVDFQHREETLGSVSHAKKQAAHYGGQKTFFVLTHAGLAPQPWIGGMDLGTFAKALLSKYQVQNLEGGTLCLLVCFLGQQLAALANELKSGGINNLTLYAPVNFMFISKGGIPHVYDGQDKSTETMNRIVAKYGMDWMSLSNEGFRAPGWGWASIVIQNGQIGPGPKFCQWVVDTFDPDEEET